ncbi:hypothetical protein A4H97_22950 [Niastella yeongjuensis]|uniref:HTH araC/xylS-type domain-containing protein n=1 Tax=Niastella yeongjuensis TaxID=354355 RepID=A0A1V9F7K1_9BACT|nr:AraC family transcriptional regulator [Niastella yeongjuensis]OQP54344.1 hypothetical protein A4H97_22950 [Niastella yeongjuensis]SEP29812.1 AraC-type DNA-binding protein [Niastella yeongjuensis]
MKPIVQKVLPPQACSFVVKTVDASWFQPGIHQHVEFELILFTQGAGTVYIGEYEGKYEAGDIFFIGSNLPHLCKSNSKSLSALVIQFRDNFWGSQFMNIPEFQSINQLLKLATSGLQVKGYCKQNLPHIIQSLETATGIYRVITLLQCLETISTLKDCIVLTKKKAHKLVHRNSDPIDKIIEFTLSNCHQQISLSQVSILACMSIATFCTWFKRRMHKTFIDFLNEVRIAYACNQLLQTNKPVTAICYESGYNTVAYFHRQFFRLKKTTPLQYRKSFAVKHIY